MRAYEITKTGQYAHSRICKSMQYNSIDEKKT